MRPSRRLVGLGILGAVLAAAPAQAALEWATWVANGASLADGSFSDGQTAIFSGNVVGIRQSGESGTASPAIPGESSGGNPPRRHGHRAPVPDPASSTRVRSSWA